MDNDKARISHHQLFGEMLKLVEIVDGKPDLMAALSIDLKKLTVEYRLKVLRSSTDGKRELFEQYYGVKIPEQITVFPPSPVKITEEMREKIRMQKLTMRYTKPKRRCSKCKQMTNLHDARNCGKVEEDLWLKYVRERIDGDRI